LTAPEKSVQISTHHVQITYLHGAGAAMAG
jgi:hypothetical protein